MFPTLSFTLFVLKLSKFKFPACTIGQFIVYCSAHINAVVWKRRSKLFLTYDIYNDVIHDSTDLKKKHRIRPYTILNLSFFLLPQRCNVLLCYLNVETLTFLKRIRTSYKTVSYKVHRSVYWAHIEVVNLLSRVSARNQALFVLKIT